MPSMSYCKFENTQLDLTQCVEALRDAERPRDLDQSSYEDAAMHEMFYLCSEFLAEYRRLFPDAE